MCVGTATHNSFMNAGQPKSALKGHKSAVNCLRFSKTADILLSGSVDKAAIVWTEGIQTHVVTQHSGERCAHQLDHAGRLFSMLVPKNITSLYTPFYNIIPKLNKHVKQRPI